MRYRWLAIWGVLLVAVLLAGATYRHSVTPRRAHRYADYLEDKGGSASQCALPVERRSGAWACPSG